MAQDQDKHIPPNSIHLKKNKVESFKVINMRFLITCFSLLILISGQSQNTPWTSVNIGIGTTSPTTKLQVKGGAIQQINADNASGIYLDAPLQSEPKVGWRVSDNSERFRIQFQGVNTSLERLGFFKTLYSDTEVFSVLANGRVGIGNNNPERNFHVDGGVAGTSMMLGSTTSMNRTSLWLSTEGETGKTTIQSWWAGQNQGVLLLNPNGGNIGVGTFSPSTKLQVKGGAFQQINADNFSGIYLDAPAPDEPKVGWRVSDNSERFRVQFKGVNTSSERLAFFRTIGSESEVVSILANGSVGIGTNAPGSFKLAVEGKVGAREIQVKTTSWADFVFEDSYRLRPLPELENYIKENQHLPEVPSEKDIIDNGHRLGEMDVILLKKIEELTLYVIEQQKRIEAQNKEIETMKLKIK